MSQIIVPMFWMFRIIVPMFYVWIHSECLSYTTLSFVHNVFHIALNDSMTTTAVWLQSSAFEMLRPIDTKRKRMRKFNLITSSPRCHLGCVLASAGWVWLHTIYGMCYTLLSQWLVVFPLGFSSTIKRPWNFSDSYWGCLMRLRLVWPDQTLLLGA